MNPINDPRVFFAAERTLLAWLRTALAIVGLGFIVSRFGLFLRLVNSTSSNATPPGSAEIGVGMVALGALVVILAAVQHVRFCRGLGAAERPAGYWMGMAFWVSLLVAASSALLAVYLAAS